MSDLALIREALRDPTIAAYPDFTKAIAGLCDQMESFRSERSYVIGVNHGFDAAMEQALEIVEHENTKWLPGGPVDVKGLLRDIAKQLRTASGTTGGDHGA